MEMAGGRFISSIWASNGYVQGGSDAWADHWLLTHEAAVDAARAHAPIPDAAL